MQFSIRTRMAKDLKNKILGKLIKKIRQKRNLSQAVVAKSFRVNEMCLSSCKLNNVRF